MKKKKYSKPRVSQVRLALQNPVLGLCFSVDAGSAPDALCNQLIGGDCPEGPVP
jgi:hypothetical protein